MMLFFEKNRRDASCAHKKNKCQKKFAPLQVRRIWSRCQSVDGFFKKRALSWASPSVRPSTKPSTKPSARGSLSLEGAMCLSLFLFLCMCLIMPMRIMDRQRRIQAVMESVGEELSRYAYVEYCFRNTGEEDVDTGRADRGLGALEGAGGEKLVSALGTTYAAARILSEIDGSWIQSVSFEGTDIGNDEMIHIVMSYGMRLPFSVFGLKSISVKQVCSRRMWTGAEGGRHGSGQGEKEEKGETVYIGKNSTRYHRQRTCHYLYNNLEAVSSIQVDQRRNQSGGRYSPCRTCGADSGSAMVYIMPYGTSYHSRRSCSSIIAYVREVPLSQAAGLGPCSYCGGG